uniref:dTDP-glucose 4,6-dehydratase n=1 Tax=Candidatus Kentrum sp. FM TaxID=2126340 RepID=A0A450TZ81_9GAMM|nr:MAG: dTDP-glucose 4,6-dehydratase [Candidatus Kentron sp. FM]VFJ75281.1 MAG: dTDP-glucose 4,6-dehydratase [Candidatus Kentron sp. FM]VFK21266.1 MAG: dTDP-glucose 4,6-dehydratase [Candidatus Kentron sp. FM]
MKTPEHRPARLLVTGGAGFIGANFVHYWLGKYPEQRVVVLDALTYAGNSVSLSPSAHKPGYRFVQGDIGDHELVKGLLREEAIDTIVHFAAESHVDRSIQGPDAFIETNIVGTHALLKAARSVWLRDEPPVKRHRFHHVSTDEVYGSLSAGDPAFTESSPYAPNSPYAASKAASDHLVRAYQHTYGLSTTISNCSNNYGPYQFPEKLIPLVIINILGGRPLPVYGDGSNIRDWLYVEDHCRGVERVIRYGRAGAAYNIGGNNEWRNIDIVRLLCRLLDDRFTREPTLSTRFPDAPPASGQKSEALITFVADRPGHDWRYAIDAARATQELAYAPVQTFETGIGKTIDWYLGNESWWRAVMGRTFDLGEGGV